MTWVLGSARKEILRNLLKIREDQRQEEDGRGSAKQLMTLFYKGIFPCNLVNVQISYNSIHWFRFLNISLETEIPILVKTKRHFVNVNDDDPLLTVESHIHPMHIPQVPSLETSAPRRILAVDNPRCQCHLGSLVLTPYA